ncbi:hypothetical protein JCGZ_14349 [Jatropha curcas]|uniref:NAD-dependent epimerase/dehydratase domain-containing protein n=1 Tax=Jatropha curcas TaxID=180498 RepID=A0A067K0H6_JATCU|nr:hypothetical protein JCGZ_14349 [Jatropha curcas]
MSQSMGILISQVTEDKIWYPTPRQLEDIIGKLPIVHIEDVREAHIFCIEKPSVSGRFLCAKALLSSAEIANYWQKKYPHIAINGEFVENLDREIVLSSTKLKELGFEYKHGVEKILDDTLKCAQELGQPQF